ncbi:MAG: heavy metal transporter [Rhodospirillaceae bacterium]|nr:MAG: heavy metal transporter [Rhodospirillaceae bacterium]
MSESYSVLGMTCGGCAKSVTNAIMDAASDATVSIDLDAKTVTVDGIDATTLKQVIEDAGFEFSGVA